MIQGRTQDFKKGGVLKLHAGRGAAPALKNVCPCNLFCDDAPLRKCKAGLKLGSYSPRTGCSLEQSLYFVRLHLILECLLDYLAIYNDFFFFSLQLVSSQP